MSAPIKRPNPGPAFSVIPIRFFDEERLTMALVRVMSAVCHNTNRLGWCRVKQSTIAENTGLCRPTVNLAIKQLIAWGYIQKHVYAKGQSCGYRALMDSPLPPTADDCIDEDWEAENPTGVSAESNTLSNRGCQPVADRGCQDSPYNKNDSYESSTKDSQRRKKTPIGFPIEEKKEPPKAAVKIAEFAPAPPRSLFEITPKAVHWHHWINWLPADDRVKASEAGRIHASGRWPGSNTTYAVPDANVAWLDPSARPLPEMAEGGAA